jgi:hypothetical protein
MDIIKRRRLPAFFLQIRRKNSIKSSVHSPKSLVRRLREFYYTCLYPTFPKIPYAKSNNPQIQINKNGSNCYHFLSAPNTSKKIRTLTPIQTIKGTSQLSIYDYEHFRLVLQIYNGKDPRFNSRTYNCAVAAVSICL